MPTPTHDLIASSVLSSSASSVMFSSITSNYQDLVLVISGTGVDGEVAAILRFNGDSASNYSYVFMRGSGSAASAGNANTSSISTNLAFANASLRGSQVMHIMDYSATDKYKNVLTYENSHGVYGVISAVGRWSSGSIITSIQISTPTSNYDAGTRVYLYGIAG